jgi:hypothetical protein
MLNDKNARTEDPFSISRAARVVERLGLAMSGAICGTFVAAYLSRADVDAFDSISFIAAMILCGIVAFYLGIDIPGLRVSDLHRPVERRPIPRWDTVELLSAAGTFLAAISALTSVYAIVFDDVPQRLGVFVIGGWWLFGVIMQIGAGAIGRLRLARSTA